MGVLDKFDDDFDGVLERKARRGVDDDPDEFEVDLGREEPDDDEEEDSDDEEDD